MGFFSDLEPERWQMAHVRVSVRTYHSHRATQHQQRVHQADYTVDESGATLNAVSRSGDVREEEERLLEQMASSSSPTTSIFIRDWKVRGFFPLFVCLVRSELQFRGSYISLKLTVVSCQTSNIAALWPAGIHTIRTRRQLLLVQSCCRRAPTE